MNQNPVTSPVNKSAVLTKAASIAKLAWEQDALVVPMSMVVLRSQTDRPDMTLRYVADLHPNQNMAYLTACTFYGVLMAKSSEGLPLDRVKDTRSKDGFPNLDMDGGPIEKIFSDTDRLDMQRIAWNGLNDFKEILTNAEVMQKPGSKVLVFPNPANSTIRIKLDAHEAYPDLNIKIVSPEGRLIYGMNHKSASGGFNDVILDVGNWPASLYILRAEFGENHFTTRFFVN